MLRRGWGDGNAAAVALPPVPEAVGGLEPRFCLLFWSRFPWRRDLCKRHHLSWRHQGHLRVLGRPRPPPDPKLSPCHQSQALAVPIIVIAGPWHPPCATVGILSPGHCSHHSLVPYCHHARFVTTTTVPTRIFRGVTASLSLSWSLCPCYWTHTVPTKATLSPCGPCVPLPPWPPCPYRSHSGPTPTTPP